jgi:hypothetical protein
MQVRVMAKDRNIPKAQDAYKTIAYASGKEGIIHCSNHMNTIRERLRTEGYWVQDSGTTFHM